METQEGHKEAGGRPGIRETARRLHVQAIVEAGARQLAASGASGLSLRAIARELGMASSAIYRYSAGADALLTELIVRAYSDLGEAAENAAASAEGTEGAEGAEGRFMAACHACRTWALAQPHRYALIYGSPVPSYAAPPMTVEPAARVGLLLLGLVAEGVRGAGSAADGGSPDSNPQGEPEGEPQSVPLMDPGMAQRAAEAGLPPELLPEAVDAWTHLFGMISFELFGHYQNVVADRRAYFDRMMRRRFRSLLAAGKY